MKIIRIGDGAGQLHPASEVGAKAANLLRMAAIGLPVPPAFVLPISLCHAVIAGKPHTGGDVEGGLREGIDYLEKATGRTLGDRRRPLLVSVRSGAERSMPGMLDTVLDVGCTIDAVHGLIRATGRPRLAWDCRRRFLESYGETVLGLDAAAFARLRAEATTAAQAAGERDLDCVAVEELARRTLALIEDMDDGFADDPREQLGAAARAVYRSWTSERARTYRRLQGLDHLAGTAVTVQAMVFGNAGLTSGAGVAFSRDPSSGEPEPMIDMVLDGQGEDVVSGRRPPDSAEVIARALPDLAVELGRVLRLLEREFGDVQDVEFTVENGRLFMLQTRTAKRTPRAALRIATDLVREGLISPAEALHRLDGIDLATLSETRLANPGEPALTGIGASGGVACGRAAFTVAAAERIAAAGEAVILLRPDTSTSDVAGFAAAAGIVTATGARTSHAALVARQLGKPCVVGCAGLVVDDAAAQAKLGAQPLAEGAFLAIDGDGGGVYLGHREIVTRRPEVELAEVARWRADTDMRQVITT